MSPRTAITRTDLVCLVLILGFLAAAAAVMLYPVATHLFPGLPRAESRRIRCRDNLRRLANGLGGYVETLGDRRWYPCPLGRGTTPDDYNGAEWLASLYWTAVIPDPRVFLCPSSGDANDGGRQLGEHRAPAGLFGSQTVSYAAMHYHSLTNQHGAPVPGPIPAEFPRNLPMASDDTQGTINHGEAMNACMAVLFFDGHVEVKTNTEVDVQCGVGQRRGTPYSLLWQLRN